MTAASNKANIKILVKLPDGGAQMLALDEASKSKFQPGAKIALVDQSSDKPVQGLKVIRRGHDLVLELEAQGEVATVTGVYSTPDVTFCRLTTACLPRL